MADLLHFVNSLTMPGAIAFAGACIAVAIIIK
jgi:hypothetical protein